MLNEERYLHLYSKIAESDGAGIPLDVSLEQLSEALFCTQRNVKLILRKLEEDGLIEWTAGRGRGNRSKITFLATKEEKLLQLAEMVALKGEYKHAFELIQMYGEGTSVRQHFVEWMNGQFGYKTVQIDDSEADILRLPVYKPILTLDPKDLYYSFSAHMVKQLFDCLVQYDRATKKIVPSLAHAWECDASGKEWSFHLRRGVHFHHGRELIADDVIYTLERLKGSAASGWFVRSIVSIESKNKRSVTIKLDNPNWLFLRFLCSPGMSIVPHELVHQDERFWQHPVGTGPFRFVKWTVDRFTMEANPHYFQGRAHLDGVVIVTMPEDTHLYTKTWEQILVENDVRDIHVEKSWQRKEYIGNDCGILTWNMGKKGPVQSQQFRKAINILVDRNVMIEELGEHRKYPAVGFFTNDRSNSQSDNIDYERAKQLLKESGYKGETIRIGTYGTHEQDAIWLQKVLSIYGVNIDVQVETFVSIREPEVLHNVDCLLFCIVFAEDEVCMIELFEQTGNFISEHLDKKVKNWVKTKIDSALACKEAMGRWKVLMEIEEKLREEAHVLFLTHNKRNTIYNPSIKGVSVNSLGWIDFKDIWMEKHVT
ncbi:SgrR family transcriptional regulator [Paenibacillus sp. GSMTC-2017]|uniref:ABC transporter substrate-binding protein n=1 Tax=Paenibacillus sp. GSMTC-2017 TaxID=2794350 RepID=UPI0018D77175|nr:ABC transporter substrate-binding protein [Paenibacillus sp. GSMTC-2017]MBH5316443.1 SgrR family transcriptional regulator [Paenibacillus sp. GSMTC-2017]